MCLYPSYELSKEYQQARLREAEKEWLIGQLERKRSSSMPTRFLVSLGDLLVISGLKLKSVAEPGLPL